MDRLLLLRSIIIKDSNLIKRVEHLIHRRFQVNRPQNSTKNTSNDSWHSKQIESDIIKKMLNHLPLFASGEIVRGFGRGSKELGIPTANYPLEVVKSLPDELQTGVYYGWANVDNGDVQKMVMSMGWNPFYNNTEKSVETHILHDYNRDLYGNFLKICIVGFLRPERNFDSLDDLITAIKLDIDNAKKLLDNDPKKLELKDAQFFKEPIKKC